MSPAKVTYIALSLAAVVACAARAMVLQHRFAEAMQEAFPSVWAGFHEFKAPWWNNDQDPADSACRSYVLRAGYRSLADENIVKLGEQSRVWAIATYLAVATLIPIMFVAP